MSAKEAPLDTPPNDGGYSGKRFNIKLSSFFAGHPD
jgi:hypothetical protein